MQYRVGGKVIKLEWDPTGRRMAVLFDDSELVALFRLIPSSITTLAPFGFIRGHDGELPVAIAFQKGFSGGALLSIVSWDSSLLKYFQYICTIYLLNFPLFLI